MLDYGSRGPRPHHRLQENGRYIFCSLLNLLCFYPQVLHALLWSRWYCKQIFVSLRTDALCCMGKQNRCLAKADFTKWVSLSDIWTKIDYFLNIKKNSLKRCHNQVVVFVLTKRAILWMVISASRAMFSISSPNEWQLVGNCFLLVMLT